MANDLTASNNKLMKSIGNEILGDKSLEKLYGMEIANQKETLKAVFTQITDNDVNKNEKIALEKGAESLLEKITSLEGKMKALKDQIDAKNGEIEDKADEIADLVAQAQNKSTVMENNHREVVKTAVNDVFTMYKNGKIGQDRITQEISVRIRNRSSLSADQAAVEKILGKLDSQKAQVDNLAKDASDLIDSKNILERQFGVTQSAYNLINKTLSQIGNTETTYKNSDYDTNTPIYSLDKTDIATNFFDNKNMNVLSTNSNYNQNTSRITPEQINSKYSQYFATSTDLTDYQAYTNSNDSFSKLDQAIGAGLLKDLKVSGMSQKDMAKFFATNFAGAQIKLAENGDLDLPVGQDSSTQNTINKVSDFFKNMDSDFLGVKNTWDKDQGNTIDSNNQIKALSQNYKSVIDKLANGQPPFSFKEAMYVLFDKNNGLFKNSGITYDLNKQGKEPNYSIDIAGDEATNNLYKDISKLIYDEWGVKANQGSASESINIKTHEGPQKPAPVIRGGGGGGGSSNVDDRDYQNYTSWVGVDPLTFRVGDSEYAFIMDRNNDGKFTDLNEFVGAKEGTSWLQDLSSFDYNNDGIIDETDVKDGVSALSQIKLLGSTYQDNAKEDKKGDWLRGTENEIGYSIQSAEKLGIAKIDLSQYFDKEKGEYDFTKVNDRTKDIMGKDKTDVNGSQIFNDGFNVSMKNGSSFEAKRKDDSQSFMETVYGAATDKSFTVGLTDSEADELIDKGYEKFQSIVGDTSKFEENAAILKNFDNLRQEARTMYQNTNERILKDEQASLTQANNKARAQTTLHSWSSIENQVRSIASVEGIDIDMEQAKGIYNSHTGMGARSVVNEYKKQTAQAESINNERNNSNIAWEALIKCFKNGLSATTSQINQLLSEGKANSADEIVALLKQEKNSQNS